MTVQPSRIAEVFVKTAREQRLALMPFVMAGDPDLQSTADVLLSLQAHGADVVELGIPYSDPLADGPVIQAAAHRALEQKTTPVRVLEMLQGLRDRLTMPVVLFTYSNPLLNRGPERFSLKRQPPVLPGWWCRIFLSRKRNVCLPWHQNKALIWCFWLPPQRRSSGCSASLPPVAVSLIW